METKSVLYDAELVSTIKKVTYSGKSIAIVTETEPSFRGGKKCPFKGHVLKVNHRATTYCGNYHTAIVNRMMKYAGLTREEAETEYSKQEAESKYNHVTDMLMDLKSDPSKLYVCLLQNPTDVNSYYYMFDGQKIERGNSVFADIESWLTPKSSNARLDAVGVAKEHQVIYNSVKLENVKAIHRGEKIAWCAEGWGDK